MPRGLKRYQQAGELYFITFSCYRRLALLSSPQARRIFQQTLERVRRWYDLGVFGYVVMPEHVHLLVSELEQSSLAVAIQMLKQIVAQNCDPVSRQKQARRVGHPDPRGDLDNRISGERVGHPPGGFLATIGVLRLLGRRGDLVAQDDKKKKGNAGSWTSLRGRL